METPVYSIRTEVRSNYQLILHSKTFACYSLDDLYNMLFAFVKSRNYRDKFSNGFLTSKKIIPNQYVLFANDEERLTAEINCARANLSEAETLNGIVMCNDEYKTRRREITAKTLQKSVKTLNNQLPIMFKKCGVKNEDELVKYLLTSIVA